MSPLRPQRGERRFLECFDRADDRVSRLLFIVVLCLFAAQTVALPLGSASPSATPVLGQEVDLDSEEEEEPLNVPSRPSGAAPDGGDGTSSSSTGEEEESPLDSDAEEEPPGDPAGTSGPAADGGDSSTMEEEEEEEEEPLDLDAEEEPLLDPSASPEVELRDDLLDDLTPSLDEEPETVKTELVSDIIKYAKRGAPIRNRHVRLLKDFLRAGRYVQVNDLKFKVALDRKYVFDRVSTTGKGSGKGKVAIAGWEVWGREIDEIVYYEERMLRRAAEHLRLEPEELANPQGLAIDVSNPAIKKDVQRTLALLSTAIKEHDSAVQRNFRRGTAWEPRMREPLVQARFNIQRKQIRQLLDGRRFEDAELACERLGSQLDESDGRRHLVRGLFEKVYLVPADEAFQAGDYTIAREQLGRFTDRYPLISGDPTPGQAAKFRNQMISAARDYVQQATRESDLPKKLALLDKAAAIWPYLEGLETQRRKSIDEHPTLECAYVTLPKNLSPLTARTPVERHTVGLMYESLVRWTRDPATGAHYATQLGEGRPIPLERGRRFHLSKQCVWSDSTANQTIRCTVADIYATIDMLKQLHPPGFAPKWEGLLDDVGTSQTNDPYVASITLRRDHWQPLSLMDFMVLPGHRLPPHGTDADERDRILQQLNAQPVGTGPYTLLSQTPEKVRFVANPFYRRADRPLIREIAFNRLEPLEALEQFQQGTLHLIHGLGPEHVSQLEQRGKKVKTLRTNSVCFLAPNYRRATALKNQNVRLAIAHAIDRENILNRFFRAGGLRDKDHAALSGPYPQDSWAYNEEVTLFKQRDLKQAQVLLDRAKQEEGWNRDILPLSLTYPARDPAVEQACDQIKNDLQAIGIALELTAVEPDVYHDQVVKHQMFELAYWRHDFEDETFWLEPMFDPDDTQKGGANFTGYHPPEDFLQLFQDLENHKRFSKIKASTHAIHDYVARCVPMIPLWQLDTYVAVQDSVQHATLDPLWLFHRPEDWELEKRERTAAR